MSLEIRYYDIPDGAQDDMHVSAEGQNDVSVPSVLSTGVNKKAYATLEPGVWVLDGTREILPDAPEFGFWSQTLSGSDGRFADPPVITLEFDNVYSSTGITFSFSPGTEQWCSEIIVTWYNANAILAQGIFYPTNANWILNKTVESFDRIKVELISTNLPRSFAKIERIEIGQTITFGAEELKNARLVNEIDPTLCELSADMMSFEVVDSQNRNLIPQESQEIELIKDGVTEAVHYITSSDKECGSRYLFSGQSIIGLLEGTFMGGIYKDKPVSDLLSEVLGEVKFDLHSKFSDVKVTGYIPILSQRNALQQIAFAIGAIITTRGGKKIRFVPIPTSTSARFSAKDIFLGGKVKSEPRIAKVEVMAHSYTLSDEEETLMQEEEISGSNLLLTFPDPHHSYSVTGGTILSSDANWVRIDVDGPVTLKAKKYHHNTITHSKQNAKATAKEQGNVISVTDATLVNNANVQKTLDRLYDAYLLRKKVEQQVTVSNQRAGQLATTVTPWDTLVNGMIFSMDSKFTQKTHIASIELHGVEIPAESVSLFSGDIYSGETEALY